MMKKILLLLGSMFCIIFVGCGVKEKQSNEMYIYYLNADGNALVQEVYPLMDVDGILDKMKMHTLLPHGVEIEKYKLDRLQLMLYFNEAYLDMNKSTEVLVRAAIVQTMTQLSNVEFVSFYIGNDMLRDNEGNAYGLMTAQDFVQNTGSSIDSYQTTDLRLYFADKEGKQLKETKKSNIRYNANTAIERLVVEQLMKGTSSTSNQSVIPKTTKLLGVSVKDGVCYVNFDSKFVTDSYDLNPEVTIYAIVNSIIANANVTKVQILIEGANDVMYKNIVDLSKPLEWNVEIVKE
ncbi:MAG: GerMN domain-containing protein [Tyzzerella sp.]|nr:GerMN domain-containing protein [Tyzzerella sp.]